MAVPAGYEVTDRVDVGEPDVTTPMFADRLEVHHHDDQTTVYKRVYYWPYRGQLDILDEDGRVQLTHVDVLNTYVGAEQ